MRKECSAWCRPDEGIHVVANAWRIPVEELKHLVIGQRYIEHTGHKTCIPAGSNIELIDVEPAFEVSPEMAGVSDTYPYAGLTTFIIISNNGL
ncbi:MAG: hypothetical protein ACRCZI_06255 [Cetobacterium sp.]